MITAIFIDGPLQGEVISLPQALPVYEVFLPPRITWCNCNPDNEDSFPVKGESFNYHAIMRGNKIVLYSKHKDDEQILYQLKAWAHSDLTKEWNFNCRDKRAFQ